MLKLTSQPKRGKWSLMRNCLYSDPLVCILDSDVPIQHSHVGLMTMLYIIHEHLQYKANYYIVIPCKVFQKMIDLVSYVQWKQSDATDKGVVGDSTWNTETQTIHICKWNTVHVILYRLSYFTSLVVTTYISLVFQARTSNQSLFVYEILSTEFAVPNKLQIQLRKFNHSLLLRERRRVARKRQADSAADDKQTKYSKSQLHTFSNIGGYNGVSILDNLLNDSFATGSWK